MNDNCFTSSLLFFSSILVTDAFLHVLCYRLGPLPSRSFFIPIPACLPLASSCVSLLNMRAFVVAPGLTSRSSCFRTRADCSPKKRGLIARYSLAPYKQCDTFSPQDYLNHHAKLHQKISRICIGIRIQHLLSYLPQHLHLYKHSTYIYAYATPPPASTSHIPNHATPLRNLRLHHLQSTQARIPFRKPVYIPLLISRTKRLLP
jgi:hypothetical protein